MPSRPSEITSEFPQLSSSIVLPSFPTVRAVDAWVHLEAGEEKRLCQVDRCLAHLEAGGQYCLDKLHALDATQ